MTMYSTWPVKCKDTGKVSFFASKKEAVAFCAENNAQINFEAMDPRIWQMRERGKLDAGVYVRAPLFFEDICNQYETNATRHHYVHLTPKNENTEKEDTVSFIMNHEHGVMDRRTIMRPGRYLERFFRKNFSTDQIREYSNKFYTSQIEGLELKIGFTREEFRFAFDGQIVFSPSSAHRSCMSYSIKERANSFYGYHAHPAEVYAAGDLAVAYYTQPENPNRVLARTIIYPKKKIFSKTYAVRHTYRDAMIRELEKQGMCFSTDLVGANLLYLPFVEDRHSALMPFIDGEENYVQWYAEVSDGFKSTFKFTIISRPEGFDEDEGCIEDHNALIPESTSGRCYINA